MQNRYPMWVNLLVAGVVLFGLLFALPNIFGQAPAIQVALENGEPLDETAITRVEQLLAGEGIETTATTL